MASGAMVGPVRPDWLLGVEPAPGHSFRPGGSPCPGSPPPLIAVHDRAGVAAGLSSATSPVRPQDGGFDHDQAHHHDGRHPRRDPAGWWSSAPGTVGSRASCWWPLQTVCKCLQRSNLQRPPGPETPTLQPPRVVPPSRFERETSRSTIWRGPHEIKHLALPKWQTPSRTAPWAPGGRRQTHQLLNHGGG